MDDRHADRHLAALKGLLDETIGLLERHGEDPWADWLRASRRRLTAGDVEGLDHLLQAFGGMGSFSDLFVMRVNGHRVDPSQKGEINERLARLRSGIWTEATAQRHALQSSDG